MTSSQAPPTPSRLLTVPNALCVLRLLGAPLLYLLAVHERRLHLLALFVVLSLSDWLDGKIAVRFDQRSRIGPKLDSAADITLYLCLFVAAAELEGAALLANWFWFALPVITYLIAGLTSVAKFSRWPSHHTRLAKVSWFLVLVGVVLFVGWSSPICLRVAMVTATMANLQSLGITWVLHEWRADVLSIADAQQIRDGVDPTADAKARQRPTTAVR